MDYRTTPYFHAGRASDLTGKDRVLYRFFELIPGLLAWFTMIGIFVFSWLAPVFTAVFVIIFDVYWLLKTLYLSTYLRQNWSRLRHNMKVDWSALLANTKHDHIVHLVILPFYKEGPEVVEKSIEALRGVKYNSKRIAIVLACEARAGEESLAVARAAQARHASAFFDFLVTVHPADVPGEMPGKGSNISYAAEQARELILKKHNVRFEDCLVSAFDIDTVVYPAYFECLTWHFLTTENPHRASFQPVPFFNNNIWDAPAISRVVAFSATFWQMIQQERPERLATFSSHAVSFKALHDIGYWQRNMVSEDSRIFWNAFVAYNGDYRVVPLSYPVSMDANLSDSTFKTWVAVYKQQRRWGWGVENVPYILMACVKNKAIPLKSRLYMALVQIEGFWSLSTHPFIIFFLSWLPVILGGYVFNTTILSYNLPTITRSLVHFSSFGLIFSAIVGMSLLPKMPDDVSRSRRALMLLQWLLVPITILFFSALPGLESQTRLMLGRYMGFWVTPKHRVERPS